MASDIKVEFNNYSATIYKSHTGKYKLGQVDYPSLLHTDVNVTLENVAGYRMFLELLENKLRELNA